MHVSMTLRSSPVGRVGAGASMRVHLHSCARARARVGKSPLTAPWRSCNRRTRAGQRKRSGPRERERERDRCARQREEKYRRSFESERERDGAVEGWFCSAGSVLIAVLLLHLHHLLRRSLSLSLSIYLSIYLSIHSVSSHFLSLSTRSRSLPPARQSGHP